MATIFLILILCVSHNNVVVDASSSMKPIIGQGLDFARFSSLLDIAAVNNHLRTITDFSSRVTGYPDCDAAADYIHSYFENLGLEVTEQTFDVVVPVSHGASISILSAPDMQLSIFAMEPNDVVPVTTPGITGQLVYVGEGAHRDFDGKNVEGSIVLMTFNTGYNWLNAAKFGAKAVIFIEPQHTIWFETQTKRVDVPLNFPRFYMPHQDAQQLLALLNTGESVEVEITSLMKWENRQGTNIIANMPSATNPDQIVIMMAHYDSYSVAQSLSPGANDAVGIATLLELARVLKDLQPKYSIMFVTFAGHHQNLIGSKQFVREYFFGAHTNVGNKVILALNLQISTRTNILATNNAGVWSWDSNDWGSANQYFKMGGWEAIDDYMIGMVNSINTALGKEYSIISAIIRGPSWDYYTQYGLFQDGPVGTFPDDAGSFAYNYCPGISIITMDGGDYLGFPSDTYEKLDFQKLENNVKAASNIAYGLVFTENLRETYLNQFPLRTNNMRAITGKVVIHNESISDYQSLPNSLVTLTRQYSLTQLEAYVKIVGITDDEGRFNFENLMPGAGGTHSGRTYNIQAFKINETNGNPLYGPDLGIYKWRLPEVNIGNTSPKNVDVGYYVVSECGTIILMDTISPRNLQVITPTAGASPRSLASTSIDLLDFKTHVSPEKFGYGALAGLDQSISVLYVPANTAIETLINEPRLGRIPLGLLINASTSSPEGRGFEMIVGDQSVIFGPLELAKGVYYTNTVYLDQVGKYGIASDLISDNALAGILIESAERALREQRYSDAYELSMRAWSHVQRTYEDIRFTVEDTAGALPFFAFLMTPFAIIFESVVLGLKGRKMIFATLCITVVMVAIFTILHPSFALAANAPMLVMAVATIVLTLPAVGILISTAATHVKKLAWKVSGVHFAEISKGSAALLAFNIGFENLRRRKLRSILTVATIILITMALVLFTSMSAIRLMQRMIYRGDPPYQAVYFRWATWGDLGQRVLDVIENRYSNEATIIPRAWLYFRGGGTVGVGTEDRRPWWHLWVGSEFFTYYVAMGLTPQEADLGFVTEALVEGSRWFIETDELACILPTGTSEPLGVSVGDKVYTLGKEFVVIGILDSASLTSITDIDLEAITPWDQTVSNQFNLHIDPRVMPTIIVPYKTLMMYDPWIASITVIPKNPEDTRLIAEEMFNDYNELNIFSAEENVVYYYNIRNVLTLMGWEMQLIPVAICAFMILNIMVGSVQERRREIFSYSSVGLSPFHISLMFLAESSSFAVLGSVLGYAMAMVASIIVSIYHPGAVSQNYSSGWVIYSMGAAMLVTIASTIYPMLMASRLVTPSLTRTWKPPTKPKGDTWSIPLPFIASDESEAAQMSRYLVEYATAHKGDAEVFSASSIHLAEKTGSQIISMSTRLEPYESGVTQNVQIVFTMDKTSKRWNIELAFKKTSGPPDVWTRLNTKFVDSLRKQFLLWRSLPPQERKRYEKR